MTDGRNVMAILYVELGLLALVLRIFAPSACGGGLVDKHQASSPFTTFPETSVNRKSRPSNL
jgi:hypothetical protein